MSTKAAEKLANVRLTKIQLGIIRAFLRSKPSRIELLKLRISDKTGEFLAEEIIALINKSISSLESKKGKPEEGRKPYNSSMTDPAEYDRLGEIFADLLDASRSSLNPEKSAGIIRERLMAIRDEISGPTEASSASSEIKSSRSVRHRELPDQAPERYIDIPPRSEKASAFLRRVWGPWLNRPIYQYELSQLDPELMSGLRNEFRRKQPELQRLVPPKWAESDKLLKDHKLNPKTPGSRAQALARVKGKLSK